jgi:CRP-like cAMP-binding protein
VNFADLFRHDKNRVALSAGHALFQADDEGELMYVLLEGLARILVGSRVVDEAGPGALLGELALIDPGPRAATVVAVTDCVLVPIDLRRFHSLVQETPDFATHVMKIMADRLRRTDALLLKGLLSGRY